MIDSQQLTDLGERRRRPRLSKGGGERRQIAEQGKRERIAGCDRGGAKELIDRRWIEK